MEHVRKMPKVNTQGAIKLSWESAFEMAKRTQTRAFSSL